MEKEILKIENLSKRFGKQLALNHVNLTLSEGKIVGLLGPNGSGKTTMIKILNGLLANYDGQVSINGFSIGAQTKKLVSYLPDEPYFEDWMYAKDAIHLFADMYPDFDLEQCLTLMARFALDKNMKIKSMSKGMKEKFQLCLVMSRKAKVYVLDEPIAGVDPAAREVILDVILNNYAPESLVLISTHLIADLETIFDEVVFIKDGEIVLHENAETLREQKGMSIDQVFREVFKC